MTSEPVNYFSTLEAEECWALLGLAEVGRVAWRTPQGLTVVPVNFAARERSVTFHTRMESALSALVTPTEVAFEVDDIDHETAVGWSVLIRGTSGPAPEDAPCVSWLVQECPIGVSIMVHSISGRVVSGCRK